MSIPPPLLALFYGRVGDSRLAELEAVAQRRGAPAVQWCWDDRVVATHGGDVGPQVIQPLPPLPASDHGWLADAAAQSVGCRGVFEVWGQGDSVEACAASAAALSPQHVRARVHGSWRVESAVLGARRSQHRGSLGTRMAHFGPLLDILDEHPVDLDAPDHRLWLVEDRQRRRDLGDLPNPPPKYLLLFQLRPRLPPIQTHITALDLSRRAFLSTSTLPPERALLMCNLGLARAPLEGATVLDPYCGSGGILLAAAALGATVVGSDLDWRMVSDNPWPIRIPVSPERPQRGVERVCMRDNFVEAGLAEPRALLSLDVGATTTAARLLEANQGRPYDALICDPPYGRREFQGGTEAWAGELSFKVDPAALGATLRTLLQLARQTLSGTGRLVFLAPVCSPKDPHKPSVELLRAMLRKDGETHGLLLVHLGVEVLHRGLHRALVVMERCGG